MASTKIFRFDDVCINADIDLINNIASFILQRVPDAQILFGISPLVHDHCGQRVFPEMLNAYSDFRKFFAVDRAGIPGNLHPDAQLAGHGLYHIDHRLLTYEQQEMSIITSCALIKCKKYIPPFNKWNSDTEKICNENSITLIKFEDGWLSMEYNAYNSSHAIWYLHAREWTMEKVVNWFNNKVL